MDKEGMINVLTTRCKCCLRERLTKDLWGGPYNRGDNGSYGTMITNCFRITWSEPEHRMERICYPCIGRLQDAYYFKHQILEAQQFLSEMMDEEETDVEQKLEGFIVKHLNVPTKGKKFDTLDNDSIGCYTEVEYLEVENSDKICNDIDKTDDSMCIDNEDTDETNCKDIGKSSDRDVQLKPDEDENLVIVGNTFIKKVKNVSFATSEEPHSMKVVNEEAPSELTASQLSDDIVVIYSHETTPKKKSKNLYTPKKAEVNRNVQFQMERIKHQENLSALLLSTNATPIHKKRDKGYECGFCSEIFMEAADLKTHTNQYHTDEEKEKYMTEKELGTFIVKLDITDLQCNHCGLPLHNLEATWEHLKTHNVSVHTELKNQIVPYKLDHNTFKCFMCELQFVHFRMLTRHMNSHYPNFMCETCGTGFMTKRNMMLHSRMHIDGSFQCSYCPKKFSVRHKWRMHEHQVHEKKRSRPTTVCGFCGLRFTDQDKKYRHLESEHGIKRITYECDVCNKPLANKRSLRNHIANVHYKLKRFQCPLCPKEFYDRSTMTKHAETHKKRNKKVKGMRCDFCPKIFSREASLKLHLRAHSGDQRYICDFCSEVFLMKSGLLSHMRAKHGVSGRDLAPIEDDDL